MKTELKMRYYYLVLGATLGFLVGALSMKVEASDANNEIYCLAQNIYFEAGNQPLAMLSEDNHVGLSTGSSDLPSQNQLN